MTAAIHRPFRCEWCNLIFLNCVFSWFSCGIIRIFVLVFLVHYENLSFNPAYSMVLSRVFEFPFA